MKKILIVGCGFNGFCNALQLSKNKNVEVTLIDKSKVFGGIMNSRKVFDFFVDNGVHVFDGIPENLAKIVKKILKNKVDDVDFISQSAFNNKVTKGFSLPDLSSVDNKIKKKIQTELLQIQKKNERNKKKLKFKNLYDFFKKRYGKTAANIISTIFQKIYNTHPIQIEPQAISQTSLARLKFLNDKDMLKLKKYSFLDTVLAARRRILGKVDDLVSIYPSGGKAMREWCDESQKYLKKKGVRINLGEEIKLIKQKNNKIKVITQNFNKNFDKVLWCNDNLQSIVKTFTNKKYLNYQHNVPVVFYTFVTNKSNIRKFTYLQNFDLKSLSYRIAASGSYSNQKDQQNNTFLTIECPTKINSAIWNNPEKYNNKIWNECKKLNLVKKKSKLVKYNSVCIPVTLKMPKLGYTTYRNKVFNYILKKYKNLYFDQSYSFFRREIYLNSLRIDKRLGLK